MPSSERSGVGKFLTSHTRLAGVALALVLIAATAPVVAQEFSDRSSQYLSGVSNDGSRKATELGDFNGDGSDDIVISRSGTSPILLINENGELVNRTSNYLGNASAANNSNYGEAFDANGDGWTDVVFGRVGNTPYLFLNQGNDGNGAWLGFDNGSSLSGASNVLVIESGDVTGDGAADLFVIQVERASNRLLVNDGNGNFTEESGRLGPLSGSTHQRGHQALLDDVEGDGDIDIVYVESDLILYVYYNDGTGNFSSGSRSLFRNPDNFAYVFGAADFNGDGIYDYRQYSNPAPLAEMSTGTFDANGIPQYTVRQDAPMLRGNRKHSWSHMRDIDADGDIDYVLSSMMRNFGGLSTSSEGHRTEVVLNMGGDQGGVAGTFTTFVDSSWANEDSWDARIVDINLDGNMDMFVAHTNRYAVYINNAPPRVVEISDVVAPPVAAGSATTFSVTLDSGVDVSYQWDFGDGSPAETTTENTISHTYAAPGRYQATVTATDSLGNTTQKVVMLRTHDTLQLNKGVSSMDIVYEERADGDRVYVVNPDNDTVTALLASTGEVLAEIPVGDDPRSLALDVPGILSVVNKGDATVTRIDTNNLNVAGSLNLPRASRPHGIVFNASKQFAYIALEASGKVVKVDFASGQVVAETNFGPSPRELALSGNGSSLYAPRFISLPAAGESTRTPSESGGQVVVINTSDMTISRTIEIPYNEPADDTDTEIEARGIPNYLRSPALSPSGFHSVIPAKVDNVYRGSMRDGNRREHDMLVRGMLSQLELTSDSENLSARFHFDNLSHPTAVAFGPTGNFIFSVHEGSRVLKAIDFYSNSIVSSIEVGFAPQGLAVSADGTRIYVHNYLSRSVSIIDASELMGATGGNLNIVDNIDTVSNEVLDDTVLLGKRLFHDSKDTRLASQEYISCAACHDDAGHDGRVWDFSDAGEGLRNTIDLRGRSGIGHGNVHWSANFNEFHDFENDIREIFDGSGLLSDIDFADSSAPLDTATPKAGRSADLDALAAYAATLTSVHDSPARDSAGNLTEAGQRGKEVFRAADCALCHSGIPYSDSITAVGHNIGTVDADTGGRLGQSLLDGGHDTPTLRGLWHGAPYLHDGSAQTLQEAVLAHNSGMNFDVSALSGEQLDDLASYLLQIDGAEPLASSINDVDGDGISNAVDPDDDNDGVEDINDAFPNDPSETADSDGDGVGDNADALPNDASETLDTDADGVGDNADVFPADATEFRDTDGDGTGDNADLDADNDGIPDEVESAISVDSQVASALSASLAAFESASTGDWVSVTAAEYDTLSGSLNNASAFGTAEDSMRSGTFSNFAGGRMFTFGQTNNPSPANSYFVAFKRGTGAASSGGNDIVRLSANNGPGDFNAVGNPLPDGALENSQEYFVLKGSDATPYSDPQYLGLSTDQNNPIYYQASGTSGFYQSGSVATLQTANAVFGWSMQGIAVPASGSTTLALDVDADGRPNEFDLDSDNDGIADVVEAGGADANNDGYIDDAANSQASLASPLDSDSNGVADYLEVGGNTLIANPITDVDNDGWDDSVDGLIEGVEPVDPVDPVEPTTPVNTAPSNPNASMLVDGNFSDWENIGAYVSDANDVDGANNTLDFASVWIAHDDDNLFVRYDNHAPDAAQLTWGYSLQLDTDANPATGFKGFANELPIGVDYMLEGGTLHRYSGTGNDFSWEPGVSVQVAVGANALELSIPRAAIGSPTTLRVFLFANNEAVNGTAVDFYPDAAGNVAAELADRSFEYYLGTDVVTPVTEGPEPPSPSLPPTVFYNPATITVDGDLTEWALLDSFGADPDDATGTGNTIDWREAWVAHDANNFYIGWRNDEAAVVSWGNGIMLDSDQNPASGFRGFYGELSIGVDYLLEDRVIHRYIGAGNDWVWVDAGVMEPVISGNNTEVQIARSVLGNPTAINLFFSGNNEAVGGTVVDYYPDQASNASASFDDRSFTYTTVEPTTVPTTPTTPSPVSIVLDGSIDEWPDTSMLGSEDANDVDGLNTIDWRSLRVMDDANNLYIAYESWELVTMSWGYGIYIDTDQNPATGFKGFGGELSVGAEYLLEGVELNRYTGTTQNQWSWESAGLITVASAGNIGELSIPRNVLGNPVAVDLLMRGDNTAVNGDAVDYHPNTGQTLGKLPFVLTPVVQQDEPALQAATDGEGGNGGGAFGFWSMFGLLLVAWRRLLSASSAILCTLSVRRAARVLFIGSTLALTACGGGSINSSSKPAPVDNNTGNGNSNGGNNNGSGVATVPNNNPSFVASNASSPSANASFALTIASALDGAQMIPPVATRAVGSSSIALNSLTGELTGQVTHSVSDATGAVIREGGPGQSGAVIVTLVALDASTFVIPDNTVFTAAQRAAFNAGLTHVSVLSVANPDGEIRSQLSDEKPLLVVQQTLDDIQAKVFSPICSGCHTGGGSTLPGIMNLASAEGSFNALVNTPALNEPELERVTPNDADNSLLIHKLEGTHQVGSQMPFRGTPLDTSTVDAIRQWIDNGASR